MDIQTINFLRQAWFQIVMVGALSYLIGSISFSILLTRYFNNKADIRELGSGNAGFTNVLRSVGVLPAVLTLLGDFGKGMVACLIGRWIFSMIEVAGVPNFCITQYGVYIAGVACLVGHVYPCFFGFRGGKAILTAFSMLIMTDWRVAALALATFLLAVLFTRLISLGSILAAVSYPISTFCLTYFYDYLGNGRPVTFGYIIITTTLSALIGIFVIYKHKKNLFRLLKGEEKPISIAKKS